MTRQTFLYLLLVLIAGLIPVIEWARFRRYWNRACTGKSWKTTFPAESKDEIRKFLTIFVRAFGFWQSRKLRFKPADQILQIYRTRYPSPLAADSLEMETLAKMVKRQYGVDLVAIWHPAMTLGELFAKTRRRVA